MYITSIVTTTLKSNGPPPEDLIVQKGNNANKDTFDRRERKRERKIVKSLSNVFVTGSPLYFISMSVMNPRSRLYECPHIKGNFQYVCVRVWGYRRYIKIVRSGVSTFLRETEPLLCQVTTTTF